MPTPSFADPAQAGDLSACRAILREGSKSFHAASLLLPARVRGPATALYAFCRVADDAIDMGSEPDRLARLSERLDRAYRGRPLNSPIDRSFASVVAQYRIPRAVPEAMLEGFSWDAENRGCADFAALEAYAVRVAGTVGLMMALVMNVRREPALARALDLGVAMQLTNVARDVGEDARMGRLYLPLDWLEQAGIDPQTFLARPTFGPEIAGVVQRLLRLADVYYARADFGVAALPMDCRPAISAARRIYSGIGTEIARAGFDSVSRRAVVGRGAKLWRLMAAGASVASVARVSGNFAPVEEARPLLAAIAAMPEREPRRPQGFGERVGSIADICARLEQQAIGGGVVGRG